MLYVVQVLRSGPVGARSSLYRLEAIAPALSLSSSAWLFTARSLNSSCSMVLPSVGSCQPSAISYQLLVPGPHRVFGLRNGVRGGARQRTVREARVGGGSNPLAEG